MGIRHWFREHLLRDEDAGDDVPPGRSWLEAILNPEDERQRALGEYTSESYPRELRELLQRREQVMQALLRLDVTDSEARAAAIPTLQKLLRTYPHPLVYETLIHAYVDAGKHEEARGVAFAARERRQEVMRSPHPEIRAEVEHLREWTTAEVEEISRERGRPDQ